MLLRNWYTKNKQSRKLDKERVIKEETKVPIESLKREKPNLSDVKSSDLFEEIRIREKLLEQEVGQPLYLGRRTGRSTRIIDKYIQELFTKGFIIIKDHPGTPEANKALFYRVAGRLGNEHRAVNFHTDPKSLTIKVQGI